MIFICLNTTNLIRIVSYQIITTIWQAVSLTIISSLLMIRFEFGKNWQNFLQTVDVRRFEQSEKALEEMLGKGTLYGKRFLDIGSGSGLSSLAALRLGARVHSFDFDPHSVACAENLRDKLGIKKDLWIIERGDILDQNYIKSLGQFDIVYAWGVLHHTGDMWQAITNTMTLVTPGGLCFIALYNDQGWRSHIWRIVKWAYCNMPPILRFLIVWPAVVRLWGPATLKDIIRLKPFSTWRAYSNERGMSPRHDIVDWIGGYPFEVAKPDIVKKYFHDHGFRLVRFVGRNGIGCNEFVFEKSVSLQ